MAGAPGMQFHKFDLNLLRSLDALLSERSVTRAAERLFVTQQAMSGTLSKLRVHFDDELLIRVGRQFELSPLAESLARPVREAMLKARSALETMPSFDPASSHQAFRVALTDYAAIVLLPKLIALLSVEAPNVQCRTELYDETSFHRLEMGELDFCIAASIPRNHGNDPASDEIIRERLFTDDFVCAVDPANKLVDGVMTPDLYRRLPHNTVRLGRDLPTIVEESWRREGHEPRIVATAPNFSGLIFMLRETPLVATVQRRLATVLAASMPLKVLECPVAIDPLQEDLLWHKRYDRDPRHAYFRQAVRQAAERM